MPSVSNFELFSSKLRKIERNAKENAFFFSFPSARNFGRAKVTKNREKKEKGITGTGLDSYNKR